MSEMQNSALCNLLFYPNVCHVCKQYKNIKLYTCCECRMISYCNKTHQAQHWHRHKEICKAIKCVLGEKKYMNTDEITARQWRIVKRDYMQRVEEKLQRKLNVDETQMFLFPKACEVCYRQDVASQCHDCPAASFCINHKDKTEHEKVNCSAMRGTFSMDIFDIMHSNVVLNTSSFIFTSKKSFHDMRDFMDSYVQFKDVSIEKLVLSVLFSEYMTGPLTIYSVLKKINYPAKHENIIVHIIAPDVIDVSSTHLWKILFHLWHPLNSLTITMVGTNFKESMSDMSKYHTNIVKNKRFFTKFHAMSYHDYMRTKDFEKPNFIVGFNALLYNPDNADNFREDNEITESLPEQNCSLILAFDKLYQENVITVECSFYEKNPFASLKPYRYPYKNQICFRNTSLIVFEQLKSNLAFINKNNRCGLFFKK